MTSLIILKLLKWRNFLCSSPRLDWKECSFTILTKNSYNRSANIERSVKPIFKSTGYNIPLAIVSRPSVIGLIFGTRIVYGSGATIGTATFGRYCVDIKLSEELLFTTYFCWVITIFLCQISTGIASLKMFS